MHLLSLRRLATLAERANEDDGFRVVAGRFEGAVVIVCDDESGCLCVRQGVITGVSLGNCGQAARIELVGNAEAWQQIWSGLPRGLHRAWRHRLLEFRGIPQVVFTHWKMIWRLGELMVASGWGAR